VVARVIEVLRDLRMRCVPFVVALGADTVCAPNTPRKGVENQLLAAGERSGCFPESTSYSGRLDGWFGVRTLPLERGM
jgi:hypothetical protein